MSDFLRRNKKKGLLGLLLLWFRERKVLVALVLVAVMLSFVFIAPSNFASAFGSTRAGAAIAWLSAKLGVRGVFGNSSDGSFKNLMASFRAAKEGRDLSWSALFGNGAAAIGESSVGLVRGDADEFGVTAAAAGRGAKSINGILNPADAGKSDLGVALNDSDLTGERAGMAGGIGNVNAGMDRNADANTVAAGQTTATGAEGGWAGRSGLKGGAGGSGTEAGMGGSSAYASRGFFSGKQGAIAGDPVKSALYGTRVPRTGGGKSVSASAGRLSALKAARMSFQNSQAMNHNTVSSAHGAFSQLAQGRARAMMARDPDCTATNGCPSEYAATNAGAVYDGNKVGPTAPQVISAPPVDGATPVTTPSDGLMQGYLDEAQQAEEDAKKCKESDERYTPREQYLSGQLQSKGNELQAMDCGGGGCSKSKANRCKAKGEEMKGVCRELNSVQCAHIMACPLTAPDGCPPPDCNR